MKQMVLMLILICAQVYGQVQSDFVPSGYSLSFQDEFESITLDADGDGSHPWAPWWAGWNIHYLDSNGDLAYKGDGETLGLDDEDCLHQISEDGTLKLFCRPTPSDKLSFTEDKRYIGGMISANQSFSQKEGYWEVRARFDVSQGILWTIWLLSDRNVWPPDIDLIEIEGKDPSHFYIKAHGAQPDDLIERIPVDQADAFHTYSFLWNEDHCIWYLEGHEIGRTDAFINDAMYLLITCEVGTQRSGQPDASTVWPSVCEVDYVRIYEAGSTGLNSSRCGCPDAFLLMQNYPNPFNPDTEIQCQISEPGLLELTIYDITGKQIRNLLREKKQAGQFTVNWNGKNDRGKPAASGYYFYKLSLSTPVETYTQTRKMLLIK